MKRLLLLFLLVALPAEAGPRDWIKHHKRFVLAATAVVGASIIQYKGTSYCQRGDVEQCFTGYGNRRAFDWISIGVSGAMLGAAEGCWKDQPHWKFCYVLAYGVPAFQVTAGIHDFMSYKPEKEFSGLPDILHVHN